MQEPVCFSACIFLFNTDASASFGDEVVIVKHDVIYHFVKSLKDKLNEKLPTVEKYISKGILISKIQKYRSVCYSRESSYI